MASASRDLTSEVAELRAENQRLRGLLGLDTRTAVGHLDVWSPTLLAPSPTAMPAVNDDDPVEAKIAVLRRLFGARSDVYALRWSNASSGKSGWSPATKGGWSKQRSPRDYLELTDEVFARHLRGEIGVGIYPLAPGDVCGLLACDFDKGTWALDALAYLDVCHANGVPAALERSRSGNGAHVWIFFDGTVAATQVTALTEIPQVCSSKFPTRGAWSR